MRSQFVLPQSGLPLVILEAGVNHNGDLKRAKELVRSAAKSGANFIKFQTYSASKIAAKNSPAYWNLAEEPTTSQFELFQKYDGFSIKDYKQLISESKNAEIGFLTTCFDNDWLEMLADSLPFFKVASADITNHILLRAVASKNKPILLSTGAASFDEVSEAVDLIRSLTQSEICLMHCVLNYPTEFADANLGRIVELKKRFPELLIGYSDHTRPEFSHEAISIAWNLGAVIIEKHFTDDKSQFGNDHYHSFDEADVRLLYKILSRQSKMTTFHEQSFLSSQASARQYARRGLYAASEIQAGQVIDLNMVMPLRPTIPDFGFSGNEVELVVGRIAKDRIEVGNPILKNSLI